MKSWLLLSFSMCLGYVSLTVAKIHTYFTRLNDIIKKGKISPRVRFALQDVVDLRENKWVPRQQRDSQVKTIDQIHREAHDEEQLTKQIAEDKMRGPKPGQDGDEDWSKVDKRPQQSRPDLDRIRSIKKPGNKEKESSGLRAVSKWGTGSKGPATSFTVTSEPPKTIEKPLKLPSRLVCHILSL